MIAHQVFVSILTQIDFLKIITDLFILLYYMYKCFPCIYITHRTGTYSGQDSIRSSGLELQLWANMCVLGTRSSGRATSALKHLSHSPATQAKFSELNLWDALHIPY